MADSGKGQRRDEGLGERWRGRQLAPCIAPADRTGDVRAGYKEGLRWQ